MGSRKLTNRELADLIGGSLAHVARAAAKRGIPRDEDGLYIVDDGVETHKETARETDVPQPSQTVRQTGATERGPTFDEFDPIEIVRLPYKPSRHRRAFRTTVFLSDIHIPLADPFALRAARALVRDLQPDDVILGGDIADLESASMHPGNPMTQPTLPSEVKAARAFLDDVRADAPHAEITFLDGNHETRPERKAGSVFPGIVEMLGSRELLDLDARGIRWLRYKSLFCPSGSDCAFTHGELEGKHHASSMLDRYGMSVVYGHTHRPQLFARANADGRLRGAWGNGCLRDVRVKWVKGPPGWLHGLTIVHHYPDGGFTPIQITMDRQRFVYGGVLYDGRA